MRAKAEDEDVALTTLVGFDEKSVALLAVYAREKGAKDRYQVDRVKRFLQENARTSARLKVDPESSTVSVVEKVAEERKQPTLLRTTPKGSKGSLGGAEGCNKIIQEKLRTENIAEEEP